MNPTRRELTRAISIGAAAAVIAVPIALVAATREPLEGMPRRGGRASQDDAENDSTGGAVPQSNDKSGKNGDRQRSEQDNQNKVKGSTKQTEGGKKRDGKTKQDSPAGADKDTSRKLGTPVP